jgi:hypothetical protein
MSHVRDEKGIMKEEENHESVTRFTGIKEKKFWTTCYNLLLL